MRWNPKPLTLHQEGKIFKLSQGLHTVSEIGDTDAAAGVKRVEDNYKKLIEDVEISNRLADEVKEMGWASAWFAINIIIQHCDDAKAR